MAEHARRAVLFDFDGTVVDTRARMVHCFRAATSAVLGRPFPATLDDELAIWRANGRGILPRLHPDLTVQQELTRIFTAAYAAPDAPAIGLFPGMRGALEELRGRGHRLGVVTAKSRIRFDPDIANLRLGGLFDMAVCAEDVGTEKPDPAGILRALNELRVPADAAAMVGDSPQDIWAGRNAGTRSVGAGWGLFGPQALSDAGADLVVGQPDDLPPAITRLLELSVARPT
jgi:HAD superfamily hydrolase (TIGR01509 family)